MIALTPSAERERVAREIWLSYYNRVLWERGVVPEEVYRKMRLKIQAGSTGRP